MYLVFGRARTVQPLGVVLGGAQRWQTAQAAVDGGVSSGEVHGGGGVELSAGRDEGRRVVEGVVGTPGHATDLIMDFCQVSQLQCQQTRRGRRRIENDDGSGAGYNRA